MSESNPNESLMSHEYDGIREYDNPTPGWWHAIFIGTFFFSIAYILVFHLSPSGARFWPEAKLETAAARAALAAYGQFEPLNGERVRLVELSRNEDALKMGATIFASNCAVCHGQQGEGLIGPNLTDDFGKNVKMPEDVYGTIFNGVVDKGMPAWSVTIGKNDVALVASYVISLRGKNIQGIKGAEGEQMPAWSEPSGG